MFKLILEALKEFGALRSAASMVFLAGLWLELHGSHVVGTELIALSTVKLLAEGKSRRADDSSRTGKGNGNPE